MGKPYLEIIILEGAMLIYSLFLCFYLFEAETEVGNQMIWNRTLLNLVDQTIFFFFAVSEAVSLRNVYFRLKKRRVIQSKIYKENMRLRVTFCLLLLLWVMMIDGEIMTPHFGESGFPIRGMYLPILCVEVYLIIRIKKHRLMFGGNST